MSLHGADSPLVSCILPVFNGSAYLEQAIASILSQTYSNFELIIINDGSTDSSGEISDRMAADPRIRVVHQPNQGIVAALNNGIAIASGDYIARMDADDIALPHRFERQVETLENNPNVVLLGCRSDTINAEGEVVNRRDSVSQLTIKSTAVLSFPPSMLQVLHPTTMMRADAIRQIEGYSSNYLHCEDYDMYLRISSLGDIAQLEEVLLQYRIHGANVSVLRLREQEENATRSDIDNVNAARRAAGMPDLVISPHTVRGYINFRCFRRQYSLRQTETDSVLRAALLVFRGAWVTDVHVTLRILSRIAFHTFNRIGVRAR